MYIHEYTYVSRERIAEKVTLWSWVNRTSWNNPRASPGMPLAIGVIIWLNNIAIMLLFQT